MTEINDAWMQHPSAALMNHPMFKSVVIACRPSGGTPSTPKTGRINGSENCFVLPLCTSPLRSPGSRR